MVKKILILISAAIGMISTFLPWATSNASGYGQSYSESINGTNGDGWITFVLFAIVAVIAAIFLKKILPGWAKVVISLLSAICALIAIVNITNASKLGIGSSASAFGVTASSSIGIGLILVIVAAAANIIISWLPLDKKVNK